MKETDVLVIDEKERDNIRVALLNKTLYFDDRAPLEINYAAEINCDSPIAGLSAQPYILCAKSDPSKSIVGCWLIDYYQAAHLLEYGWYRDCMEDGSKKQDFCVTLK